MTDPLGNTGKSTSLQAQQARLDRFRLQSEARRLSDPKNAIQGCLRWPTGGAKSRIAVKYRRVKQYAFYGGLQTCGQIWRCPVCANKITERRRQLWWRALSGKIVSPIEEYDGTMIKQISYDYRLAMGTFTIQHNQSDSLFHTMKNLNRAYQLTWSGKWSVNFRHDGEVIGTVRALEVTHGASGWHPHIHCMFVTSGDAMRYGLDDFRTVIKARWAVSADKAGGFASIDAGCDFRVADIRSIEYIDKLGIETHYEKRDSGAVSEVTKYPTKKGRGDNVGLFGLLALSADGKTAAGARWEAAQTELKGRKHIATSKGLLRTLGASQELSDDRLAATDLPEQGDEILALLERDQWEVIDRRNLRGELLNVAMSGNKETVSDFLIEVGAR